MESTLAGAATGSNMLWSLCLATAPLVRPENFWRAWSFAPATVLPLLVYVGIYAVGSRRRREHAERSSNRLELAMTGAGVGLLVLALMSPLCRLSTVLASGHMVQHVILVALAPPFLLLGAPRRALEAAFGTHRWAAMPGSKASRHRPVFAAATYGLLIWFWHIPAFYEAALSSTMLHLVFLVSLLAASLWFWSVVVASPREQFGAAALILLATMIHTGLLGALLSLATRPLYPLMSEGALAWGLTPMEDQQLAGLIMWVPMGAIYLIAALTIIGRSLNAERQHRSSGGHVTGIRSSV